jgi:general stress protein 26
MRKFMPRRVRLRTSCSILLTVLAILAAGSAAFAQATQRDIDAFSTASLVYIATVRKDGNQSKAAPVWFTTTPDHILLIQTNFDTWKAKRIRRGSPAIVWIGADDGPAFIGKAEITSDPEVINRIITDYPDRYLLARVGLFRPSQEKFDKGSVIAIKITPVHDLPNFVTQPGTPAPSLAPPPAASH